MGHEVELTAYELWIAGEVGLRRRLKAICKGQKDAYGFKGDPWATNIEGTAGEMAVAKFLNLYWGTSLDTYKETPDVGPYDVRCGEYHHYGLLVRPNDPDDRIVIAVTGRIPGPWQVQGWLWGYESKREEWIKAPKNRPWAYFPPQANLHPMDELENPYAEA